MKRAWHMKNIHVALFTGEKRIALKVRLYQINPPSIGYNFGLRAPICFNFFFKFKVKGISKNLSEDFGYKHGFIY